MEIKTNHSSLSQEKLKAIIEKAVKGGLNFTCTDDFDWQWFASSDTHYAHILFSHDFAKAFWSDKYYEWDIQLSALALTQPEERIDYLYNFLNE